MKGYTLDGEYRSKRIAVKRAKWLRPKFSSVKVKKGTKGAAHFRPRTVYRVWIKL